MRKLLIAAALVVAAGQAHAYCSDGYVQDSAYWGGCRPVNDGYQGSGFGYGESHDSSKSNTGSRYQQDYYPSPSSQSSGDKWYHDPKYGGRYDNCGQYGGYCPGDK